MSAIQDELYDIIERCISAQGQIKPKGGAFRNPSATTRAGYLHRAAGVFARADAEFKSLPEVVCAIQKANTFYATLAALRFHALVRLDELMTEVQEAENDADYQLLKPVLEAHLGRMAEVAAIQQVGMRGRRSKRSSKRQALRGLPHVWREEVCTAAARGKYADAMLVAALTGARPSELVRGVQVELERDQQGAELMAFQITGSKVKGQHGQPSRRIIFAAGDPHPLVVAMRRALQNKGALGLLVKIDSAVNLTVEVRRLATRLWPGHRQAVTAYCFRHQWAADAKRRGDADAVSRGLGHASAKTRRQYGMANQAAGPNCLQPLAVDADREVRGVPAQRFDAVPDETDPDLSSDLD